MATDRVAIREVFNRIYLRRYAMSTSRRPIEFVSLYLTGSARIKGRACGLRRTRRQRPGAQKSRPVYSWSAAWRR